jgi:hypothetical protein
LDETNTSPCLTNHVGNVFSDANSVYVHRILGLSIRRKKQDSELVQSIKITIGMKKKIITIIGLLAIVGLQILLNIYVLKAEIALAVTPIWVIAYFGFFKLMVKYYLNK